MRDKKNKTKKIILFNPNPRGYSGEEETFTVPPFSLLAISSLLDKEGYCIKIIDQTVDKDYKEQIKKNVKDALCFGVTSMTGHQISNGIEASKLAKEHNHSIPVVWGGYHCSILPEQTIKAGYIDVVVRGQGEMTFFELIKAIEGKIRMNDVNGITYKKDSKIISNPERQITDINNFPGTPFHLIDLDKYIHKGITERVIGYRTSQGCTYNCGFCAELCVTKRRWSGFEPQRVIDELKFLVNDFGIDGLTIYDSNFFNNPERVRKIMEGIIKNDLRLRFDFLNGRVDQLLGLDEDFFELLKKVGCDNFLIGAESGSQEILNLINKNIRVGDILKLKRKLKKYSIMPSFSFVFGFPRSEKMDISFDEEFNSMIKLIRAIYSIDSNNHIKIWNYTPYPGTPLFDLLTGKMKVPSSLEEWSRFNFTHSHLPWIPKRYERRIDHLNWFIFPYITQNFSINWKDKRKAPYKRIFHYTMHLIASFRFKHGFFGLPLEYWFIKWHVNRKFKNVRNAKTGLK